MLLPLTLRLDKVKWQTAVLLLVLSFHIHLCRCSLLKATLWFYYTFLLMLMSTIYIKFFKHLYYVFISNSVKSFRVINEALVIIFIYF